MIDPNSFDRIVAYGCSWTAGDELLDHEILGVSFSECNRLKREHDSPNSFNEKYNIIEPCAINRNASWAAQLAKLLNKPFENRAVGGSSMDHIYYNVYIDMIKGNITDRDLILVGLTSPNRFLQFIHKRAQSVLLGYPPHWKDEATLRLFTTICDDSYIVFSYFRTLVALNALKEHINIRIQPTSGGMSPNSEVFLYDIDDVKKYALDVWDKCDTMLLAEDFLKIEPENIEICRFQHQPVESHIALAKRIYNDCVIK